MGSEMCIMDSQMATINVDKVNVHTQTLYTGYTDSALLGDGQFTLSLADDDARDAVICYRSGAWWIHGISLSPVRRAVTLKPSYRR